MSENIPCPPEERERGGANYADPTVKMNIKPAFCAIRICRPTMVRTGSTMSMTSVAMPSAAVVMYSAGRSMHEPVVTVAFQLLSIGLQAKIRLKKMPML